jgi:hypothetical protein
LTPPTDKNCIDAIILWKSNKTAPKPEPFDLNCALKRAGNGVKMQPRELWPLMLDLSRRMDVAVRVEYLDHQDAEPLAGGFCRLRGKRTVFINKRLQTPQRLRQLGLALNRLEVEQYYLLPVIRNYLNDLNSESVKID